MNNSDTGSQTFKILTSDTGLYPLGHDRCMILGPFFLICVHGCQLQSEVCGLAPAAERNLTNTRGLCRSDEMVMQAFNFGPVFYPEILWPGT
jgi:hypothetical protein